MARLKNFDQITGNIGKLSFYTRKGSSEIFVRTKGGASREKIRHDPAFANLRKANKEFGGCSKMSKQIRTAFYGLEHVAEFNLAPALSKLAKDIQKTDTQNPVGERAITLSKYRYVLSGFDFGRTIRFNTLLRVPFACTINRETQQADIQIPEFACSFGLNMPDSRGATNSYTLFRITAALGIVTDMALNPANQTYEPVHDTSWHGFRSLSTAWYNTQGRVEAQTLTLKISGQQTSPALTDADTLLLTLIVEFGIPDATGSITPVRGAGGGMIAGVG